MSSYLTLLGAENVERAGYQMSAAAERMQSAASSIDWSLQQHSRNMDDWLNRFEALVERLEAAQQQHAVMTTITVRDPTL